MLYKSAIDIQDVSLESAYDGTQPAIESFASYFKAFKDKLSSGFASLIKVQATVGFVYKVYAPVFKEHEALFKLMDTHTYEELANVTIDVPPGFSGYLADYVPVLDGLIRQTPQTRTALREFSTLVAAIVSNRSIKTSLDDKTSTYEALANARNANNKAVTAFFATNKATRQPFHKTYRSFDEFKQVMQAIMALLVEVDGIDIQAMAEEVKTLNRNLDILIAQIQSEDRDEGMALSKQQLKNLHEGSLEFAYQAEFFSVNYYRAMQLGDAMAESIKKLNTIF